MIRIFTDFTQCKCQDNSNDLTREYIVHPGDFSEISFFDSDLTIYNDPEDLWERTSAQVIQERKGALDLLAEM